MEGKAKFFIGQLIEHRLFSYRGVIVDVDPCFMLDDQWYELMAKSRPAKDKPWYRVLVHNSNHETYVAEQNIRTYPDPDPVSHPELDNYFSSFKAGRYQLRYKRN